MIDQTMVLYLAIITAAYLYVAFQKKIATVGLSALFMFLQFLLMLQNVIQLIDLSRLIHFAIFLLMFLLSIAGASEAFKEENR